MYEILKCASFVVWSIVLRHRLPPSTAIDSFILVIGSVISIYLKSGVLYVVSLMLALKYDILAGNILIIITIPNCACKRRKNLDFFTSFITNHKHNKKFDKVCPIMMTLTNNLISQQPLQPVYNLEM